ncbi:MAG: phospholipase D-like domain-containing protein [Planctomycetota bacterium]
MNEAEIDRILLDTLADGRLSRGERTALGEVFASIDANTGSLVRGRVFALAHGELDRRPANEVLTWCESVLHLLADRTVARLRGERDLHQEAWFAPQDVCHQRIVQAIDGARVSVDVCVFTITDDRIAEALLAARRREVQLRIVTDDEKSTDPGSDMDRLAHAGIPVRTDRSPAHMHHKFALFDDRLLLTGSYNWTRSAGRDNRENFVVSDDPRLIRRFRAEFERMWEEFAG